MESVKLFDDFTNYETDWRPSAPPSLDGINTIYLDTETTGLKLAQGISKPIGISIKWPGVKPRYYPWGHAGGNLDEEVVKRWAQRELRNKRIVGLGVKTEVHGLHAWGVDLEAQGCTVSDVQHSAALLDDHRKSFKMEALAADFKVGAKTGKELDKKRMKDYHSSVVAAYAENDAEVTEGLDLAMKPLLEAENLGRVKQLEDDVIFPVCEMERNAAPLDTELLRRWCQESEAEMLSLLHAITKEVGFPFTPKTSDWAKLFRHFRIPIIFFTSEGAPSFTDAILKNVNNPFVQMGRRAAKLASLRSKFLVPYDREATDGFLRYHLHQLRWEAPNGENGGTVTGRFSSSDFNVQQVPKKSKQIFAEETKYLIRQLFIPSGKDLWFSADAKQIEFRVASHFFNNKRILQAYKDNPEVSYYNIIIEGTKFTRDLPYDKSKAIILAILYGAGRDKVSFMGGVPRSESDVFVDEYYRAFPEVRATIKKAAHVAETRGYVKTITGRRSRFPGKERTYKGLNSICQGSAADINKVKLVELHRERKYTGYLMRGTVHDETFGQVPDEESARRVTEILNRQSFDLKVPILWSGKTGPNWAACQ